MRVKICGIKNETDLEIAIAAGADAVGFLVGQRFASQDFILPEKAAVLAAQVPPFVTPVLVTHLTDPDEIIELIDNTMITTVQLHGGSRVEQLPRIREFIGHTGKLILAVHIGDQEGEISVNPADFEELVDGFLLDSRDIAAGKVGGTGKTHNWHNSAAFVQSTRKPVILAGGLCSDNVADAIRTVQPFAVDANSLLRPLGTLDPHLAAAFVQNALQAQ